MIPAIDNSHVAEGVAFLTSRYAGQPVITGLVTALMARLQVIEASYWSLINATMLANHPMAGGPWSILDQLGYLVGVLRNGLDDADFLALIKLQAKVNRSRGTPEDVLTLGVLMSGVQPPFYLEEPTAGFYLGCWNIGLNYVQFVPLLRQARAAGVYGVLLYTTWPDGGDVQFSSVWDFTVGQAGLGSVYDATQGGLLVASVGL